MTSFARDPGIGDESHCEVTYSLECVTKQREASIHLLAGPDGQLDMGDEIPGSSLETDNEQGRSRI